MTKNYWIITFDWKAEDSILILGMSEYLYYEFISDALSYIEDTYGGHIVIRNIFGPYESGELQ